MRLGAEPRWWTLIDTNTTIDWGSATRVSRRTGVEIVHVIRRAWGVSIKPEIPWAVNRQGNWKVVAILTRYRGTTRGD